MEETDLASPYAERDERELEAALRPKRLADFVGQPKVREQLGLVLTSALRRGRPPDHVLLSGAPGLGKTSLAMIIAAELGAGIRVTSGPAIERAGDLAAILTALNDGDVLFVDEIHRIARPAEEILYIAMEDFRVDVVVGKGPGATAIPLDVAPFTLVGATTRAGPADRSAAGPVRLRRPHGLLRARRAGAGAAPARPACSGVRLEPDGADEIAGRSRGTPRIANRLLRRVRDYAEVRADGVIDRPTAQAALTVYDVDELGLDRLDRAVLDALVRRFGGGPVGRGHARRRGRGGAAHGRGGRRAVPGPGRPAGPHPARPGGHPGGLGPPRPHPARTGHRSRSADQAPGRRPLSLPRTWGYHDASVAVVVTRS